METIRKKLNELYDEFFESKSIDKKTGMLKDILSYLVSFWEKELDNTIKICLQLLEPILMISVGFIVGVFIIAIIMPLFDLVNNIGL